ncbi:MAG TPA: hypothetical protein VGP61_11975, partial [Gemmatimonadales bacterium]|nr:hypothetical protein [Gemmatimonadales bacterium]
MPGPDLHGAPLLVVPHHHPARVARQALQRFCRNARPALEHGLAGLLRIGERRGIDMDHHLVALARSAGIEPMVEGRLREQGQRVGLLLGHRRALRGGICRGIIEMRRQLGDLIAQPVQLSATGPRVVRIGVEWISMASLPSTGAT